MIKLLTEVLIDMSSFFFILCMVVFGFTFMFLQYEPPANLTTFGTELYMVYNCIYANGPPNPFAPPQEIYFAVFTIFVSIVMLNLLIAIMNETYARVQDTSTYFEGKTKVNLIIEAITAKRFGLKFMKRLRIILREFNSALCTRRSRDKVLGDSQVAKALDKDTSKKQYGFLFYAKCITKDEYTEIMNESTKAYDTLQKKNEKKEVPTGNSETERLLLAKNEMLTHKINNLENKLDKILGHLQNTN